MTPFLMKHTANYMLENKEMQSVAQLNKEVPKQEEEDQAKGNEMNQAASLGIIENKYATKVEKPNFEAAAEAPSDDKTVEPIEEST